MNIGPPSLLEPRIQRPAPLTESEVAEVVEANRRWGAGAATLENACALGDPATLAVVTGQQAGLLLGPLYTVYKAIGALKLAAELAQKQQTRVAPIFWIASEDHDFDEVRDVHWTDAAGALRCWRYESRQAPERASVFAIPVEDSLRDFLGNVRGELRETEFSQSVFQLLEAALADAADLEELFARLLVRLLGKYGLVVVTPRMDFIRRRGAEILRKEFERPGESSRRVIAAGGGNPALHRRPEDVNAFLYDDEWRRQKIVAAGDGFAVGAEERAMTREELLALLAEKPGRFSFNVVTRPVAQDAIFPTAAYVGGPGEVNYLAQLGGAYEFFGVERPAVVARPRAVLVEPRVRRALEKLGLDARELLSLSEGALQARFAAAAGGDALTRLGEGEGAMASALGGIEQALPDDPALAKALKHLRGATDTGLRKLRERLERHLAQRDAQRQAQLRKALDALRPGGRHQERELNIWFPFLNLLGLDSIDKLYEELTLDDAMRIVEL